MFRAPPEVGVPGAAPAALQRQPVKFFGEALRHVGDVELQLELLGPDLVDGGIGKGQHLPATQVEPGIAALLVEPRGDASAAAEDVAREANAALAARHHSDDNGSWSSAATGSQDCLVPVIVGAIKRQ